MLPHLKRAIKILIVKVTNNSLFKGNEILGVGAKNTSCCCAQCYWASAGQGSNVQHLVMNVQDHPSNEN